MFFKKLNTKALKVFFIYEIIFTLFILLGAYTFIIQKSILIYGYILHASLICEYSLISYFFFLLYKNSLSKRIIIIGIFLFLAFNLVFKLTDHKSLGIVIVIEFLLLILCALYYFFEKIKIVGTVPIYKNITFWIVVGFLIYASGNIFAFVYLEAITKDAEGAKQLRYVYSFVTITKNLIFSMGIVLGTESIYKENKFTIPDNLNLDDFSYPKNDNPTS